jgi:putative membrane protein
MVKQILTVAALVALTGCKEDTSSRDDSYRSDTSYGTRHTDDTANPSDGQAAMRASGKYNNNATQPDMANPSDGGYTRPNDNRNHDTNRTEISPDAAFVQDAATGGKMEVQLGQLAATRAQSDEVRRFGQRMVDDHSKANDDLMQACGDQCKEMSRTGKMPESDHQQMYDRLARLNGADFDREYIRMMFEDHQKDVAAFEQEALNGRDPNAKAFAQRTIPVIREHLRMAREIAANLGVINEGTPKRDDR